MSEINLGEVFYLVGKNLGIAEADERLRTIYTLPIEFIEVAQGDVMRAARLKAKRAISYADCFCALLAIDHQAAVVTGDPDFLPLQTEGLLQVEWIGA